jgi:acetyl-CoA/propionyl-CoA carboxylase biotin carboxyl carrier protein
MNGHAIEFRIYAESPARGFVPTTGPVLKLRLPEGARVDSGITEGAAVTAAFDPMLAKIIVHGANREDARARARDALRKFVLLGCETNTDFLRRLVDHRAFANGEIHTGFLDAHPEITAEPPMSDALRDRLLAIAALSLRPLRDAADAVPPLHTAMGGWRN